MRFSFLLLALLTTIVNAFTLSTPPASHSFITTKSTTRIYAEGGAPQYEKSSAKLAQSTRLANYSYLLQMTTQEDIDYEPGHVLALEIEANNTKDDSIFDNPFERPAKTQQDIDKNDGWMRGPYTVTRASSRSFDILIKVTGEKSHRFALAAPGSAIKFGGKFKVPIVDGIKEGVKRVVMVSTGVGVGPCIGAIEKLLNDNDNGNAAMDVELLACYKEEGDVIYVDYLDEMQDKHERFHWKAILSEETGRLSASEENLKNLVSPNKVSSLLEETHYHLIGNGAMVNEFKAGLEKAGVPNDQITVEMYFNHRAEVDMDAVDRIASLITTSHAQNLAVAKE